MYTLIMMHTTYFRDAVSVAAYLCLCNHGCGSVIVDADAVEEVCDPLLWRQGGGRHPEDLDKQPGIVKDWVLVR